MKRLTAKRLADVVGRALADALMREWGGHRLPEFHVERGDRDQRIRALVDQGMSYRNAARAVGCSKSQAERIASRP